MKVQLNLQGQGLVVLGGQWGDEGKGRIVDALANECDVVVRFQGGNNAGHTLQIGDDKIVLHLIPCGIVRPQKICVIGNGVVVDPEVLFQEIDLLMAKGIDCSPAYLKVSKSAHIIFDFHKAIDVNREEQSLGRIGTTKRGIGPCYEDKIARFGIRAQDLLSEKILHEKLTNILQKRPDQFSNEMGKREFMLDKLITKAIAWGKRLKPYLADCGQFIEESLAHQKTVLFEGAQGTLLDVDHGTYPFVTSSNCVSAQAAIGTGIGPQTLSDIWMVSKGYCTRVGEGPFFSEVSFKEQEKFRTLGNEFGATTGRARRCGWLDLCALKYVQRLNGANGLVLTKADIVSEMGAIKVGVGYRSNGETFKSFAQAMEYDELGHKIDVQYKEITMSGQMPENVASPNDLPVAIKELIKLIESEVGIKVKMVSYGPKRGQEILVSA